MPAGLFTVFTARAGTLRGTGRGPGPEACTSACPILSTPTTFQASVGEFRSLHPAPAFYMEWLETARRHLNTRHLGRVMEGHVSIDSTNTRALAWREAPHGTVVVAEEQTAGRGRHGRIWEGGAGESLLLSLVLLPEPPRNGPGILPLAIGLAVLDATQGYTGSQRAHLKWPNDVLVGGRKVAGILVESSMVAGSPSGGLRVVAGIGINVNQESMPAGLEERATSLRMASAAVVSRPLLLAAVLGAVEERLDQVARDPEALIEEYTRHLEGLNLPVEVREIGAEPRRGILCGIDSTGALRVRDSRGVTSLFTAGQVTMGGRT